jgi:ABC-type uncharacterized transport system YnjBCD substrate-binding protein
MTSIVLVNKDTVPTNNELGDILGPKYSYWKKICEYLDKIGEVEQTWKYYGKKNGWLLKNEMNKRNLFFLVPGNNEFSLTFTFGDKAVGVIKESDLPKDVIEAAFAAKKYAEGRVLQIEVTNSSVAKTVCKLIDIKVSN